MSIRIVTGVLAAAVLAALGTAAAAQAPRDVPSDHWAYAAVSDLATKGLVKGYPPTGDFFGKRTVSRYEMATIVERVLGRMDDLLAQKADKGQAPAGVTQAQLDEVRKLVDEFKVELTVVGADLQKTKDQIAALQADVAGLKDQVGRQGAAIEQNKQDVAGVKQGLQSAIDAINEQAGRVDKLSSSKVEAGFGKMRVGGLLQLWLQGETDAPNRGITDGFRIRRTEIKLSGNINPRLYWWTLLDPSKQLSVNTTPSSGPITGVSVNQTSNILQEVVVGGLLNPHVALEIGQQKVPMSMEGVRSASQLLTVERSIMNLLPVNNGRVGDIRDTGAMARLVGPVVEGQLAVFNDAGNRQNQVDDNNEKEVMWHVDYKGIRHLMIGGYQEISGGVNGAAKTQRQRLGAEAQLVFGPHTLEAEAVQARDGVPGGNPRIPSHGGYLTYAYRQSPRWQFVARGEYWNPNRDLHGAAYTREYDLTLGVNYYLVGNNAKIQFNWVRKNIVGPLNGAGTGPLALPGLGLDRNLFLMNFQQAF